MTHDWAPLTVDEVTAIFEDAPFRWWLCGGVALEMYAGRRWRDHVDVDVGVVRYQVPEVHVFLSPRWDLWIASEGMLRPWSGEPLHGRHENNVWARQGPGSPWRFDIAVGSGNDEEWIYRRDEALRRPWEAAILSTEDGIRYLAPEIQLLFKSNRPTPKDDVDARVVLPMLEEAGRAFLIDALDRDHPWREWLGDLPHASRVTGHLGNRPHNG